MLKWHTRNCDGCKYWSELMAQFVDGVLKAMCLNEDSDKYQKYSKMGCEKKVAGPPVDVDW